jgi:hypothetical protein
VYSVASVEAWRAVTSAAPPGQQWIRFTPNSIIQIRRRIDLQLTTNKRMEIVQTVGLRNK